MARINLLPWRETERKRRQREFGMATVLAVILTGAACGGIHFYIDDSIEHQESRNSYLKREIAAVDRQIKEIDKLEKQKAQLIARMNVIQQLQSSRPMIVHLFDEMASTIPDGAFLTTFKQSGSALTISGRAQSNARVSTYMRSIEGSDWLKTPVLQEITSKQQTGEGLNNFKLSAAQTSPGKTGGVK